MTPISAPFAATAGTRMREGRERPRYESRIRVRCSCGREYEIALADFKRSSPERVCLQCHGDRRRGTFYARGYRGQFISKAQARNGAAA